MPKNKFSEKIQLASLILIALVTFSRAQAELGGDENSVEKDRHHFAAKKGLRKSLKYTVYDLESDQHIVHEYVDQKGQVFAVSWSGQNPPNLATLFGDHHAEFLLKRITTPKIKGQRRFQTITTSTIQVVQMGGTGHWSGAAYLLGHLPAGVSADQLR
jgi:hypothetical protein